MGSATQVDGHRRLCQRWLLTVAMLVLAIGWTNLAGAQPLPPEPAGRSLLVGAWAPDEIGLLDASGLNHATRTTLALQLLNAVGERARLGFSLRPMERAQIVPALARGEIDFMFPAVEHEETRDLARLSVPYAIRTEMLFVGGDLPPVTETGVAALRQALERRWKIGTVRGEAHSPEVRAILADARHEGLVRVLAHEAENLDLILAGEIQAFVAPRLEGLAALADRPDMAGRFINYQRVVLAPHSLHVMFSRKTVDAATVDVFDRAVLSLQQDGTAQKLRSRALTPVLLRLAAAADWFAGLDLIGTIAFALSGALIARREGYSLLGAFVLASLPAVGGGVVRDLLIGRSPIGILSGPLPLTLVIGTVLTSYVLLRLDGKARGRIATIRDRLEAPPDPARALSLRNMFEVTDALGLGAFTVIGVVMAVRYGT